MKFLLYGGKGWIGGQVADILKSKGYTYFLGEARLENKEELEKEIANVQPTHVITCTGRTHGIVDGKVFPNIDYLEIPGKIRENVRDNLFGPVVLALLSNKYGYHYTYLGTGCIFDYDEKHPYGVEQNGFLEEDKPNYFSSSYSIVKGFTDELMHVVDGRVLNVRIRMPITGDFNGRNFITKILKYKKICSVPNSMTVLPELLPLMIDMAVKNVVGTVNLTNPGLITHNEILEMYRDIVDKDFKWENFTIEEQGKILAAGRSNNFLDTSKLVSLYPNVKSIKESVHEMILLMGKNISK